MALTVAIALYDVKTDPGWEHRLNHVDMRLVHRVADALTNQQASINIDSRVYQWGHTPVPLPNWTPQDDWLQSVNLTCTFDNELPSILDSLKKHQVVCIEAPTGTGKSTIMPGVAYEAVKRALRDGECEGFDPGDGQRIIHLMPSGEQVHQNYGHVSAEYLSKAGFECGAYSSALSSRGADNNRVEEGVTNCLFSTYFFAEHALYGSHRLHTVIIDEIHELTPTVMHLLSLVREKLARKEIYRVVLLTATLFDNLRDRLRNYFTRDSLSIHFMNPGQTPYRITVVQENDDAHSQRGFNSLNSGLNYSTERLPQPRVPVAEHAPAQSTLVDRAIRMLQSLLEPHDQAQSIPDTPPGYIVFLPGAQDVVRAKIQFNTMLQNNLPYLFRRRLVAVYNVTGQERNDVEALSVVDRRRIRVCFSTPILSTGVTLSGINTVIDTGTRKLPSTVNRRGYYKLISYWQDKNSRDQRRGRVGRVANGTVYQCFTKQAHNDMTRRDHTMVMLQSAFNTSILPPALSNTYDFLFLPDQPILEELILEAGTYGMLNARVLSNQYTPDGDPRIDAVGYALSRCFKDVPLDMGVFLLYCAANKCILPGVVLVAAYLSRHSILAKPRRNVVGRDDPEYSLNKWPGISGCPNLSDMVVYTDLLMNLILIETANHRQNVFVPRIPGTCRSWTTYEGTTEMIVVFYALLAGLNALRLCTQFNYWRHHLSGVVINNDDDQEFYYAHMDEDTAHRFNACILAAFGHRVMKLAPRQKNMRHDIYTVQGVIRGGNQIRVQGERARIERVPLVVYYNIFDHNPTDAICTTHLHQFTTVDYLLYGNAHGATTDIVNIEAKTLVIQTNTGSLQFRFDSTDHLQQVALYRKAMKLVPAAVLLPGYSNHVTTMRDCVTYMPNPRTPIVEYHTRQPTLLPFIDSVAFFMAPRNVPPPNVAPRNGN